VLTCFPVGIERKVVRDTILPNGTKLPKGSIIAVNSSDMWSAEVHDHPDQFDGHRFLRMRQQGGKGSSAAPFVSSTKEHNTFGAGKFICPGRFFVANEMKIALAHVLLKYDLRLQDGQPPKNLQTGFYPSTDLGVRVEVRRRDYDLDINR
jgi:cytochrome P450